MTRTRYAIVGGGIIGAAVARRLSQAQPGATVTLLEKEDELARHQTGHNSGVVHAGPDYQRAARRAGHRTRREVGRRARDAGLVDLILDRPMTGPTD